MSTQKSSGFAHVVLGFVSVAAVVGATGCVSSGGLGGHERVPEDVRPGLTMAQGAGGLRASEAHVVAAHVNPLVPVHLSVEGDDVAVRFGRARMGGSLVHLDRASLAPTGAQTAAPTEHAVTPSGAPVRVALGDGRFVVCWKSGDAERGYRVMAQAWTGGGESLGAPVAISPADADVFGALQAISTDADHAVATFAVGLQERTFLVAVSLEVL